MGKGKLLIVVYSVGFRLSFFSVLMIHDFLMYIFLLFSFRLQSIQIYDSVIVMRK
jgi:hypothetical protein